SSSFCSQEVAFSWVERQRSTRVFWLQCLRKGKLFLERRSLKTSLGNLRRKLRYDASGSARFSWASTRSGNASGRASRRPLTRDMGRIRICRFLGSPYATAKRFSPERDRVLVSRAKRSGSTRAEEEARPLMALEMS